MEKKEIIELYDANRSYTPIFETEVEGTSSSILYRSIILEGEFLDQTYLLENRLYKQKSGYEVYSLFLTENRGLYLINRGWVPKEIEKRRLLPVLEKKLFIEGVVSPFKRFGLNLYKQRLSNNSLEVVQEIDYELVKSKTQTKELNNVVIQLSASSPYAYEPIWRPTEFKPSRHFGYAAQWWGLASVLIISFFIYAYKDLEDQGE